MRKSSSEASKTSKPLKPISFKNEAEEADWYHSREGRRYMDQLAATKGTTPKRKNFDVKPTDPGVLQALVERVKAKQAAAQTQAVSIRLSVEDLTKAKDVAERTGIGYQTVLKDLIHEGLRRVSR